METCSRIRRLYNAWETGFTDPGETFPAVDAICIAIGDEVELKKYRKSLSLQIWLLNQHMINVVMFFLVNSIHFVASKKKLKFLHQITKGIHNSKPVYLHVKRENNEETFRKLILALRGSGERKTLGVFQKDFSLPDGSFIESWKKAIKQQGDFHNVDISQAISHLLSTKEASEILYHMEASKLTAKYFEEYFYSEVQKIIDLNRNVKHTDVSNGIIQRITPQMSDTMDLVQLAYRPMIQSGGNYSLKFCYPNDSNILKFDVIICALGVRYKYYCSNILRTILVQQNKSVRNNYNFVIKLHMHICTVLRAGVQLGDVYDSGIQFTLERRPELVNKLTDTFGYVTGIELREPSLSITPQNTNCVCKSQIFTTCIGLSNLINSGNGNQYSLIFGDTVLVNENSPATPLTTLKFDELDGLLARTSSDIASQVIDDDEVICITPEKDISLITLARKKKERAEFEIEFAKSKKLKENHLKWNINETSTMRLFSWAYL